MRIARRPTPSVRAVFLMYHDIYTGVAADANTGASVYHVSSEMLRQHLSAVQASGALVVSVADWLAGSTKDARQVVLTFDDGSAGSLTTGVECLNDAGFAAAFFVTRDLVGKPRFAGPAQLREARSAGMEIGTHGTTHRFLSGLTEDAIRAELGDSKSFLEDLLGEQVQIGSVPGGAWTPAVARIARECGYRALCTSRPGTNTRATDPFSLRRVAVRRNTSPATIARYAQMEVRREVARGAILSLPKRLVGRERYAALRARILGDDSATAGMP